MAPSRSKRDNAHRKEKPYDPPVISGPTSKKETIHKADRELRMAKPRTTENNADSTPSVPAGTRRSARLSIDYPMSALRVDGSVASGSHENHAPGSVPITTASASNTPTSMLSTRSLRAAAREEAKKATEVWEEMEEPKMEHGVSANDPEAVKDVIDEKHEGDVSGSHDNGKDHEDKGGLDEKVMQQKEAEQKIKDKTKNLPMPHGMNTRSRAGTVTQSTTRPPSPVPATVSTSATPVMSSGHGDADAVPAPSDITDDIGAVNTHTDDIAHVSTHTAAITNTNNNENTHENTIENTINPTFKTDKSTENNTPVPITTTKADIDSNTNASSTASTITTSPSAINSSSLAPISSEQVSETHHTLPSNSQITLSPSLQAPSIPPSIQPLPEATAPHIPSATPSLLGLARASPQPIPPQAVLEAPVDPTTMPATRRSTSLTPKSKTAMAKATAAAGTNNAVATPSGAAGGSPTTALTPTRATFPKGPNGTPKSATKKATPQKALQKRPAASPPSPAQAAKRVNVSSAPSAPTPQVSSAPQLAPVPPPGAALLAQLPPSSEVPAGPSVPAMPGVQPSIYPPVTFEIPTGVHGELTRELLNPAPPGAVGTLSNFVPPCTLPTLPPRVAATATMVPGRDMTGNWWWWYAVGSLYVNDGGISQLSDRRAQPFWRQAAIDDRYPTISAAALTQHAVLPATHANVGPSGTTLQPDVRNVINGPGVFEHGNAQYNYLVEQLRAPHPESINTLSDHPNIALHLPAPTPLGVDMTYTHAPHSQINDEPFEYPPLGEDELFSVDEWINESALDEYTY